MDYWERVFEELRRRRLFRAGLVFLALIYASAIYAPLIANDRPFVMQGVDYRAYGQALRGLYPAALGVNRLVGLTPAEYLAGRTAESELDYSGALAAEHSAIATRVETLATYLPPGRRSELMRLQGDAEEAIAAALAGEDARARALAADLKERARDLRTSMRAHEPREEGEGGIELVTHTSYPLWESTSGYAMFFMVLWAFVCLWPLWNPLWNALALGHDRARIRKWRAVKFAAVIAISLAAAGLWQASIGGQATFHAAAFKSGLTSGEIVCARAVFPPLAYGFAETHLGEQLRPPTWVAAAEISEEGYYVRGARAPEADPVTGFVPEPNPVEVRYSEPPRNAVTRHLLGTDRLGRDLLGRALWGGRVSLSVGLVSTVILVAIGLVLGCTAGYFGGRVDLVISRVIEVVLCFPVFFLILVVVAFIGPSILNIMIVIGVLRWTGVARLVRAEFLRLREEEFVLAARALGLSPMRIALRHMLPNALGPILVAATFSVAAGILVESSLSFLGFGIQVPIPSWGALVNESRSAAHWWIQLFPGLLIFLTVVSYNLVGDGIRDALDPRLASGAARRSG